MQDPPQLPRQREDRRDYLTPSPSWWERSIVSRSTYSIDNLVDTMMEHSSLLMRHAQKQQQDSSTVLQLDRDQVQLGAILGRGSFSVVSEVTGLHLSGVPAEQENKEHDDNGDSSHDICFSTVLSSIYDEDQEEQALPCNNRKYAIKHLRPDLISKSGDPEHFHAAAADLLMESRYLAAFDHPGILKLRAVARGGAAAFQNAGGRYDGFFIITDRLKGTLKDKILEWQCIQQEESLLECLHMQESWKEDSKDLMTASAVHNSPELLLLEKLDLALQLSRALLYLHDRRIIFRDLKPQNVGLTEDNKVQLFDFGFCRELPPCNFVQCDQQDASDDDDVCYYMSGKGSLIYLAPEVLLNGRYNRKADCYAFAMVLFELLTLNKPFASINNQEVFRELICRQRARPPLDCFQIPDSLRDLLRHSWDHNVSQRWTMRKICERLTEIIAELEHGKVLPTSDVPNTSSLKIVAPSLCNSPALVVDLIQSLAKDMKLGFQILAGQGKVLGESPATLMDIHERFRSNPIESLDEASEEEDSMAVLLNGVVASTPTAADNEASTLCQDNEHDGMQSLRRQGTADTADCSSRYSTASLRVTRVTPMTATEAPLEVTLEQALSMMLCSAHSLHMECYHSEDDLRRTEGSPVSDSRCPKVMEERCPPSPPLERTTSAPVRRTSFDDLDDLQVPYDLLPQYKIAQRRPSYQDTGKSSLPVVPQGKPQRRQSYHVGMYLPEDDNSHLMPSLRTIHPTSPLQLQ